MSNRAAATTSGTTTDRDRCESFRYVADTGRRLPGNSHSHPAETVGRESVISRRWTRPPSRAHGGRTQRHRERGVEGPITRGDDSRVSSDSASERRAGRFGPATNREASRRGERREGIAAGEIDRRTSAAGSNRVVSQSLEASLPSETPVTTSPPVRSTATSSLSLISSICSRNASDSRMVYSLSSPKYTV